MNFSKLIKQILFATYKLFSHGMLTNARSEPDWWPICRTSYDIMLLYVFGNHRVNPSSVIRASKKKIINTDLIIEIHII